MSERNQISERTIDEYVNYGPDLLATACPLCKKTFAKSRQLQVHDISEIVYKAILETKQPELNKESKLKITVKA